MKMPFTLDAPPQPLGILADTGGAADRDAMFSEYKAGARRSLQFTADTYVHGPNKNHTRLNTDELGKFAESFKGQPFLMDHTREQGSRGGTIIDSKLIADGDRRVIRQTIKAVKPWAIEGVLDGTVDRFSIGFDSQQYLCSVHGSAFFKCGHGLADLGELDEKSGNKVEVVLKGLEGTETSAVTNPAVSGTGVLDALRSLQTLTESASREAQAKEKEMKERILALLGLSAETTEADLLAKLDERLKAPTEKIPVDMLTALGLDANANSEQAIAAVLKITAPGSFVSATEHAQTVEELASLRAVEIVAQAKRDRKISPAGEEFALKWAKKDPAAFAEFLKDAPVGGPPPEPKPTPPPKPDQAPDSMTELSQHVVDRMGLSKEEWAEAGKIQADQAKAMGRVN